MDRREAEHLYDSGKEPTVEKLLELDRENTQLKENLARLETTSQSSSKPPSSDPPCARKGRPPSQKTSRGRKPGGQPGHAGTKRELLPVEKVSKVVPCYPPECTACPHFSTCSSPKKAEKPFRWQVTEIEPITPTVTEYQVYTLSGRCGKVHRGILPPEVSQSTFGPRLTALCAYFTAVLRMPRRALKDCLRMVFGVHLALGSTQNLLTQTSQAVAPTDQELKEDLPTQKVIGADESGWTKKTKQWIWVFVAKGYIYFHIAASRGSRVLVDVLGQIYEGILSVDRWGAYTKYHRGLLQICWAHLKRDILGIKEIGKKTGSAEARSFSRRMEYLRKRLMALWYPVKGGRRTRKWLKRKAAPIQESFQRCLESYHDASDRKVRSFARRLLKLFPHLFTFIDHEGVEPTNNGSERGIRAAVIWRKICFGNRSDEGAIISARLLTVTRTCWVQGRNALEFLVEAITVYRNGSPAPSLLHQNDDQAA